MTHIDFWSEEYLQSLSEEQLFKVVQLSQHELRRRLRLVKRIQRIDPAAERESAASLETQTANILADTVIS